MIDVPRRRVTRLLYSQLSIHFLRLGESFTREQKGGSIKILTRLARLPFLDGRVTLHARTAFLHINSFFARPVRIHLGQGEIISGRESAVVSVCIKQRGQNFFLT